MAMPNFDQVYTEHKSVVWRLVSRYVSGHHDKEDLFQEVFRYFVRKSTQFCHSYPLY